MQQSHFKNHNNRLFTRNLLYFLVLLFFVINYVFSGGKGGGGANEDFEYTKCFIFLNM